MIQLTHDITSLVTAVARRGVLLSVVCFVIRRTRLCSLGLRDDNTQHLHSSTCSPESVARVVGPVLTPFRKSKLEIIKFKVGL